MTICVAPIERDEQGPCTQLMMLSEGAMECGAPAERHPDDLAGILQPHPFLGRPTKLCLHGEEEHDLYSPGCLTCAMDESVSDVLYQHAFLPGHPCAVCEGTGVDNSIDLGTLYGAKVIVDCPAANCVLGFVKEEI